MIVDEFSGPAGSAPDPNLWAYDVGPSPEKGWERGSLQTYTDSVDNVRLDGQGHLVIEARKSGSKYTSGRIVTRGKLDFQYGTINARIKFPSGQGIWPAFWMLGSDIDKVGWPQCGEIDIMEIVNTGKTYNVRLHGPPAPDTEVGPSGSIADLTEDFHIYWVTREKDRVTIGVDEGTLWSFTPSSLPPGAPWVFNNPMHVLLNIAVGGDWPGPPDDSTRFPATMLVDWIRFDPAT
ncbi:glycoside hydrolase family 16 protein [Mycobacterium sp. 1164985.4]|uniref:glycoside hydrolase family 16 protein n=1 Tax=Mycobacterium sp. 1164985.4 TaxID=1834069 RepID=UPI001E40F526|nr:glycoside hydrolase family 16 protein [Mycobacterium sp. 1164985.4]